MFKLTKNKIIIIISLIIFIGLAIGLPIYFLLIKQNNKENGKEIENSKPYIGYPTDNSAFEFMTVNSDSNANTPNITSNVINNIDMIKYLRVRPNCIPNIELNLQSPNPNSCLGYEIQFFKNTINYNYRYYITQIDYKTNTITFNAPIDFSLNGSEAWPFDINIRKNIPPPKLLNLPADALAIAMATDTTKSA